jgi:outer membrane protein
MIGKNKKIGKKPGQASGRKRRARHLRGLRLLTMLIGIGVAGMAGADTMLTLSWPACVDQAAAGNPDLRAARSNLYAAGYSEKGAYSGFYPQVSASAGHTHTTGDTSVTTSTGGTTTVSTSGSSYNASVSASQNLFAGFQDSGKVDQSAANREAAEVSLTAAKAKLSQDLKAAFAGLRYAQDNVALTADIVRRLEQNVRLVELRFESGRENKGSYLFENASLAQARFDNLQARQAVTSAQAQLARVLGMSERTEIQADGTVPVTEPPAGTTLNFDRLTLLAPDYLQAAAQEKAAVAGVTIARAGLYPSLNVSGSVSRADKSWFPNSEQRSVGVNLSVPIFNGGRDYYASKSAAASLDAATFGKDSAFGQVLVQLKQKYAAYVESAEQLRVNKEFLDAANVRADIARSKYNNGLMTFDDWDRIETDLIQRQKQYLQSQRDRVTAEAAWEQMLGKGVIQ